MKFIITGENGKSIEVDLTPEQMEALGLKPELKCTGYELGDDKVFFRALNDGSAQRCSDPYSKALCLDNATAYSDYELAEANARADLLMRRLRRYAAQHGGVPCVEDWPDRFHEAKEKYIIHFTAGELLIDRVFLSRVAGCIYFLDRQACLNAIEEFKDELIWYFTEYEPMLR